MNQKTKSRKTLRLCGRCEGLRVAHESDDRERGRECTLARQLIATPALLSFFLFLFLSFFLSSFLLLFIILL
jgi:hypothetical protein